MLSSISLYNVTLQTLRTKYFLLLMICFWSMVEIFNTGCRTVSCHPLLWGSTRGRLQDIDSYIVHYQRCTYCDEISDDIPSTNILAILMMTHISLMIPASILISSLISLISFLIHKVTIMGHIHN